MGVELEKFVSTVDQDFICLICTFVLDNPVRISGCEHMFCRKCISDWIKQSATCPVDRKSVQDSDLIAPDRTVVNMLNKLKVKCDFESFGCKEVIDLENWRNHLENCDFNPKNKQPCVGCGKMLMKNDEPSHKCLEKFETENMKLNQEIKKLKYLVSDHQSTIEKLEKEMQKLNQENKEQNDLIKELVVKNEENEETIKRLKNENKNLISGTQTSKITGSCIDKWLILSRLPSNLKSQVKLASVLGTGEMFEAVVITKDDEAFWVKANKDTFRFKNEYEPKKIEVLSKQNIHTLVFGGGFELGACVLALTRDKKVLAWSNKNHVIVGPDEKTTIMSNLIDKKIVQLACGYEHALALTEDGKVGAWGLNYHGQLGIGTTDYIHYSPVKVTMGIGSRHTVAVACCSHSSFAVTDNGEVWAWGNNESRLLGIENKKKEINIPTKIEALEGVKIRRLACGLYHILAVTNDGSLIAWGYNKYGQLGTGDTKDRKKPVKVGPDDVKFIEVAASNSYNCLSVALSEDGRCWVWGWCRVGIDSSFDKVLTPIAVQSASIHEAIADYANFQMTWKTMVFD